MISHSTIPHTALRYKVTYKERLASTKNWDAGCDPKFDFKDGFPATQELGAFGSPKGYVVKERWNKGDKGKTNEITSKLFVKGARDTMEALYIKFREKHMLIRAKVREKRLTAIMCWCRYRVVYVFTVRGWLMVTLLSQQLLPSLPPPPHTYTVRLSLDLELRGGRASQGA